MMTTTDRPRIGTARRHAAAHRQSTRQTASPQDASAKRGHASRRGAGGLPQLPQARRAEPCSGASRSTFGPVQIVSTCRPGAVIAGSGRPSKHASGEAIDFNAPAGRKAEIVRWLIANHKRGGTMTYAGMSHIHVDIGYHFVSLNSARRPIYLATTGEGARALPHHYGSTSSHRPRAEIGEPPRHRHAPAPHAETRIASCAGARAPQATCRQTTDRWHAHRPTTGCRCRRRNANEPK